VSKKKDKAQPVLDGSRYTFRTFIKILQDNTSLKPSFYTRFNRQGAVSKARKAFDNATSLQSAKQKPGKKSKRKPATNGKDGEVNTDVLNHINQALTNIDLQSSGAPDVVVNAYRLVDSMDSELEQMYCRKQIKELLKLTRQEEQLFIREARRGKDNAQLEIDLIEKVTAEYRDNNKTVYSIGKYYNYNDKKKIWQAVTKEAIEAKLYHIVRQFAITNGQLNINNVVNESIARLRNETNGELLFNVENAAMLTGDCFLYLQDSLLKLNIRKCDHKITRDSVYDQFQDKRFNVEKLLFTDLDKQTNKIKGLYTLDYKREGLYYKSKFHVPFMDNKALRKAVENGEAKHFIRFLSSISAHLSDDTERSMFVLSVLDMMAYLIQPLKRQTRIRASLPVT